MKFAAWYPLAAASPSQSGSDPAEHCFLGGLDLEYMFPKLHWSAELGKMQTTACQGLQDWCWCTVFRNDIPVLVLCMHAPKCPTVCFLRCQDGAFG